MSEHVTVERDQGVEEIHFCRPEKKNALTLAMYEQAAEALRKAAIDEDVRCVLISGEGGHFTAGNDLLDFMQDPPTDESSPVFQFLLALRQCPRPVVAAVDGYAIGIGTTMLLHCDLAWSSEEAKYRMPFVDLGLVPEAGSSVMLPSLMGHRQAAELLYFSEFFDAQRALRAGLINGVVDGEVTEFARRRAQELAKKPPMALRLTKELLRKADDQVVDRAMREEAALFVKRLQSQEFMEAVAKFQG
jgi:enoyl-CoA hydratase/carnithine racemase